MNRSPPMKTLELSETLYQTLRDAAARDGFASLEAYVGELVSQSNRERWRAAGARMDALREELYRQHGEQPDSTPLLRESRDVDAR